MSTALLVSGLVVLVLLAVPVHVAFWARGLDDLQARVAVRWLFGLVRLERVSPAAGRKPQRAAPVRSRRRSRTTRRPGPDGARGRARWIALLRQPAFRRRLWRFLKDLAAATRPRGLRLWLRLGLGDPADTGRLWAVLGPLSALATQWRHAQLRLEPAFVEPVLEFDAAGRLRLVPLQLLALALAFALSPASIRAWRACGRVDA